MCLLRRLVAHFTIKNLYCKWLPSTVTKQLSPMRCGPGGIHYLHLDGPKWTNAENLAYIAN